MTTTARNTVRRILTSTRNLLAYALHVARPIGRHRKGAERGHHMSVQRQAAVLDALVERVNAGHMTAVEYLHGIGFPEADRYASAFGRATAAAYRKSHGEEPECCCLAVVRERLQPCFGYADAADLHAGAMAYKRTAEFLAEQRSVALRSLVAA